MTNADVIRYANDRDLAYLIARAKVRAIERVYESFGIMDKISDKIIEKMELETLDWLKREVSDD